MLYYLLYMDTIVKEPKKLKTLPKGTSKNQANLIKEITSPRTKKATVCAKHEASLARATTAINDLSCNNSLDTQRIKEAFFSSPKNSATQTAILEKTQLTETENFPPVTNQTLIKPEIKMEPLHQLKSAPSRKIKHFSWLTLTFIAAIFLFIINSLNSRYELLILNRNNMPLTKDQVPLLSGGAVSGVTLSAKNVSEDIKPEAFSIASGINEAQIDLIHPLDLNNGHLSFLINKPDGAIDMKIIVRDNKLFSNALSPITTHIDQNSSALIKADLDLSNISNPYVNPAKITQIRVYFQTPDKKDPIKILIKDLILTQKGLKD